MSTYSLDTVIEILQVSVSPVVLVSGVALIILTQTNRMAHVIDRIRWLKASSGHDEEVVQKQIHLLYERAQWIRFSIFTLVLAISMDVLVILNIFISKIMDFACGICATLLITLSLFALVLGMIAFLVDVNKNLAAIKMEIGFLGPEGHPVGMKEAPRIGKEDASEES